LHATAKGALPGSREEAREIIRGNSMPRYKVRSGDEAPKGGDVELREH